MQKGNKSCTTTTVVTNQLVGASAKSINKYQYLYNPCISYEGAQINSDLDVGVSLGIALPILFSELGKINNSIR